MSEPIEPKAWLYGVAETNERPLVRDAAARTLDLLRSYEREIDELSLRLEHQRKTIQALQAWVPSEPPPDNRPICGDVVEGFMRRPVGPCVLLPGHKAERHQDGEGTSWTEIASLEDR